MNVLNIAQVGNSGSIRVVNTGLFSDGKNPTVCLYAMDYHELLSSRKNDAQCI